MNAQWFIQEDNFLPNGTTWNNNIIELEYYKLLIISLYEQFQIEYLNVIIPFIQTPWMGSPGWRLAAWVASAGFPPCLYLAN